MSKLFDIVQVTWCIHKHKNEDVIAVILNKDSDKVFRTLMINGELFPMKEYFRVYATEIKECNVIDNVSSLNLNDAYHALDEDDVLKITQYLKNNHADLFI